MHIALL